MVTDVCSTPPTWHNLWVDRRHGDVPLLQCWCRYHDSLGVARYCSHWVGRILQHVLEKEERGKKNWAHCPSEVFRLKIKEPSPGLSLAAPYILSLNALSDLCIGKWGKCPVQISVYKFMHIVLASLILLWRSILWLGSCQKSPLKISASWLLQLLCFLLPAVAQNAPEMLLQEDSGPTWTAWFCWTNQK